MLYDFYHLIKLTDLLKDIARVSRHIGEYAFKRHNNNLSCFSNRRLQDLSRDETYFQRLSSGFLFIHNASTFRIAKYSGFSYYACQ
jgi:hypothetical protein